MEEVKEDSELYDQFKNMVKNLLMKDPEYDMKKFIGGMPVTLAAEDVSDLGQVNKSGVAVYKVTQKVDGTRLLLYIGKPIRINDNDMEVDDIRKNLGKRRVFFIDRNMKMYKLSVKGINLPPIYTSGEILLDGEIVFFDKLGRIFKELDSDTEVEAVSFMAFDILYGPPEVNLTDIPFVSMDKKQEEKIKSHVSMVVPFNGISTSKPWTYIQRYDILYNLISFPTDEKKIEKCKESFLLKLSCPLMPLLQDRFKGIKWFSIEIKPIYDVQYISTNKQFGNLYSELGNGFLQRQLTTERLAFYTTAGVLLGKKSDTFTKLPIKLDGLIFTSDKTLYTNGNWNSFKNKQFKWKPIYQQTVDLQFKINESLGSVRGLALANVFYYTKGERGEKIPKLLSLGKNIVVTIPPEFIEHDGKIGEFLVRWTDEVVSLSLIEMRLDKSSPNSWLSVLSVINAVKKPININSLKYLFSAPTDVSKQEKKLILSEILNFYPRNKLLNCMFNNKIFDIQKIKNDMQEMIKRVGSKDAEIELRFGKIGTQFNTKIDEKLWFLIKDKMTSLAGFEMSTEDLVDVYKDISEVTIPGIQPQVNKGQPRVNKGRVRSRYYWSEVAKSYIHFLTIFKTPVSKVDIDISKFLGVDLRMAYSTEEERPEPTLELYPAGTRKYRHTFTPISPTPLKEVKYKIDFTAITEGIINNTRESKLWVVNPKVQETFQIELEILSNETSADEILDIISRLAIV